MASLATQPSTRDHALSATMQFTEDDQKFIEKLIEEELAPAQQSIKFTAVVSVNHSQKKAHEKQMSDSAKLETLAVKWTKELIVITECRLLIVGNRALFGKYKRLTFSLLNLCDYYSNGSPTKDAFFSALGFQIGNDVEYVDLATTQQQAKEIFQHIWKQISFFKNGMGEEYFPKLDVPERFVKLFNKTEVNDVEKAKDAIKQLYLASCDLKGIKYNDCIWSELNARLEQDDKKMDLNAIFGIEKFVKNPRKRVTPDDVVCFSVAVEFNPFFETIECSDTDLGEDWLTPLKGPIANNFDIVKIKLSRVSMTRKTALAYGRALKSRAAKEPMKLVDFDVSHNDLGEGGVRELIEGLEIGGAKVQSLNMADTNAGTKGLKAIMNLIANERYLREDGLSKLNLGGNQLGKSASESLSEFLLKTRGLDRLALPRTGFYAKSVFNALISNQHLKLKSLDVSENGFKNPAVESLCQLIREKECIKIYNLSKISFSKQQLAEILKDVVKTKPNAARFILDFSNSNLGENLVKAFQVAAESRKGKEIANIVGLNLANAGLGISGVAELAELFKVFTALETINLSQNMKPKLFQKKEEATTALGELLKSNGAIRNLYLNGDDANFYGPAIQPIFEALKSSKSLVKLSLRQNNIKFADIDILAEAMFHNKTLKVLDLDHNLFSTRALEKVLALATASSSLVSVDVFDDIATRAKGKKNLLKSFQEKVAAMDEVFAKNGREIFFAAESNRDDFMVSLEMSGGASFEGLASPGRSRMESAFKDDETDQVGANNVNPLDVPSWKMPQFGRALREYQCVSIDGYAKPLPAVLVLMERYMFKNGGLETEGIFRLAPDATESLIVMDELNDGTFEECGDVNCMSNNIKLWFRELPAGEKLLGEIPVPKFTSMPIPDLINMISEPRRTIFLWLIDLCVAVVGNSQVNKMGAVNLAICFAPNLYNFESIENPMASIQASRDIQTFFENTVNWRPNNGHVPVKLFTEKVDDEKNNDTLVLADTENLMSTEELNNSKDELEDEDEKKEVPPSSPMSVSRGPPPPPGPPPTSSPPNDSHPSSPASSEHSDDVPPAYDTLRDSSPMPPTNHGTVGKLAANRFLKPEEPSAQPAPSPPESRKKPGPLSSEHAAIAGKIDPTKLMGKKH
jgi:Ran GTPase-activating protein (RanGAP) involved in mRNA processing and transport